MSEPDGVILTYTRVSVPRSRDDLEFVWQGGDTMRLSRQGLSDFDPYGILSNRDPEVGDTFTYGSYTLRCTVKTADYIDAVRV